MIEKTDFIKPSYAILAGQLLQAMCESLDFVELLSMRLTSIPLSTFYEATCEALDFVDLLSMRLASIPLSPFYLSCSP